MPSASSSGPCPQCSVTLVVFRLTTTACPPPLVHVALQVCQVQDPQAPVTVMLTQRMWSNHRKRGGGPGHKQATLAEYLQQSDPPLDRKVRTH
jgi:hypothetical protein